MHRSVGRMHLGGGLAMAAGALLLAACGGAGTPSGSGSTTTPTSSTSAPTGATGSTTSSTSGGSPPTSSVAGGGADAIAAALQNGQNATFDATYKVTGSASVETFEVAAQGPSTFAWIVTDSSGKKSEFIGNGTKAWACANLGSASATCIQYPSAEVSTLSAAYAVFTGKYWYDDVTAIKQYSGLAGFHESTSSMTVAGQSANCVTWTGGTAGTAGAGGEVCVTSQGILAYAHASNTPNSITLQSVSTSVSSSTFSPPSGVTVQTLPAG